MRPFLKWTGGKRWLIDEIRPCMPGGYERYFEPFLGGGAVFLSLQPWPATLSDLNEELINAYQQVRDNVEELIARLSRLTICPDVYGTIRSTAPRLAVTRAVRFLYLNRTAFNGIYRVNREGRFNVPFGCKDGTILCDSETLREASKALANRRLVACDFEQAINGASADDFVYVDPPYTSQHNNNGFRRYNERIFSWADQTRLAKACVRATNRGANVIVSNADHGEITQLYKGFERIQVSRYTGISAQASGRGDVSEQVLFSVYE